MATNWCSVRCNIGKLAAEPNSEMTFVKNCTKTRENEQETHHGKCNLRLFSSYFWFLHEEMSFTPRRRLGQAPATGVLKEAAQRESQEPSVGLHAERKWWPQKDLKFEAHFNRLCEFLRVSLRKIDPKTCRCRLRAHLQFKRFLPGNSNLAVLYWTALCWHPATVSQPFWFSSY